MYDELHRRLGFWKRASAIYGYHDNAKLFDDAAKRIRELEAENAALRYLIRKGDRHDN